ncbi:LPS export ABC transporter periplasmic protein LptC [Desulfonatronospira sp.]|uniref:LPS export ABC transporter periplasmic protein LptC n=1 Tax=Desulfonatronospira sp. TaxID=1962951 RepID=UPI0025C71F57|nr:LPS export ABC transporter periplasmic protein LptC [Desulfonatronospira sp.]
MFRRLAQIPEQHVGHFAPIILTILLMLFLLNMFWKDTPGPQQVDFDRDLEVDLNIRGLTLTQSTRDKVIWELNALEAGYIRRENRYLLHDPVMTYFGENDRDPLKIRAARGRIEQDTGTVHMWPHVEAESGGVRTTSSKATYTEGEGHVLLQDNVAFTGYGIKVSTPRALIMLEEDSIVATQGVHTVITRN